MKTVHSVLLLAALTGTATSLFWRKYFHVNTAMNWTDAKTHCRNNYVDLTIIDSQGDYDGFLNDSAAHSSDRCWIGLSKEVNESVYTQWCDGSLLGFSKWRAGEPANSDIEHCVTTLSGVWVDRGCENVHNVYCYIWKPQMVVVQEMKTWDEALKHCRTFYTDLISLDTERDLLWVNTKIADIQNSNFWIGLNFLDGSWFWTNMMPLENLISLPSCPAVPYRCGAKTGADRFENRDCSEKMFFICYHQEG